MPIVKIVSFETREVVHTIETEMPKDSRGYEKFMDGLLRKTDLERFYIDEDD